MTLVHLDLSMEVQCLKDALRYVIEIVGEQSVMTVGVMPMLKLFVDSLDSQLLVSLLSVVDCIYNYFLLGSSYIYNLLHCYVVKPDPVYVLRFKFAVEK